MRCTCWTSYHFQHPSKFPSFHLLMGRRCSSESWGGVIQKLIPTYSGSSGGQIADSIGIKPKFIHTNHYIVTWNTIQLPNNPFMVEVHDCIYNPNDSRSSEIVRKIAAVVNATLDYIILCILSCPQQRMAKTVDLCCWHKIQALNRSSAKHFVGNKSGKQSQPVLFVEFVS